MTAWMVFTDLDGTLLDARTFSFEAAQPALQRLVAARIPLVPVTSKTFAEVRPLADVLGIDGPIVIESGGGIARRAGSSWRMEGCGADAKALRAAVPEIERRADARLRLYSSMRLDEAAAVSGLTGMALRRSLRRHFDEPFLLESGSLADVATAARSLGFHVRTGGRFHHLCGSDGKGAAARRVREEIASAIGEQPIVVALGDAPMDAELLESADIPVIIPRPDGTPDPALAEAVPGARIAPTAGPRGWASAIEEISLLMAAQTETT